MALLGANGCGKSTLLKLLDGLIFLSSGTFTALGHEVTEDTLEDEQLSEAFRSRVGFVFQNSDAQVFSPAVREEVAFGTLQLGMSPDQAATRVEETLAMLDTAEPTAAPAPVLADGPHRTAGRRGKDHRPTHDLEVLPRIADRCLVFAENHQVVAEARRPRY